MEIDGKIESLVRETLEAAVTKDVDRFDAALKAFPDEDTRRKGLQLAVAVSGAALYDLHGGEPSAEQLRHAAGVMAQAGEWAAVTADEANAYLTSLVAGTPLEEAIDPQVAVLLIFVMTAALLAGLPVAGGVKGGVRGGQPGDGGWSGYLDRLEAQLQAVPDRTKRKPSPAKRSSKR